MNVLPVVRPRQLTELWSAPALLCTMSEEATTTFDIHKSRDC